MTDTHKDDDPAILTTTEARSAKRVKGMPLVLGVSLAAVILGVILFMLFFTTA